MGFSHGSGNWFGHALIHSNHAKRLLELKLIYNLLGSCRITAAGRMMLQSRQSMAAHHTVSQ
jgi:hypothetical protein